LAGPTPRNRGCNTRYRSVRRWTGRTVHGARRGGNRVGQSAACLGRG
jgi:hypothetical protein